MTCSNITAHIILGKDGPSESGQFQGLPEFVLSCLLSVLMSFLVGENDFFTCINNFHIKI